MGEQKIAEAEQHLNDALPDDLHERASELVHRLTGMELADPLRVALLLELRGLFREQNESKIRAVHRLVDLASQDLSAARDALAESFRGTVDKDAAIEYLSVLDQAGYHQEAIDFGRIAVRSRDVQTSPTAMELLIELLTRAGRASEACEMMDRRSNKQVQPSAKFLATWCRALYAGAELGPTRGDRQPTGGRVALARPEADVAGRVLRRDPRTPSARTGGRPPWRSRTRCVAPSTIRWSAATRPTCGARIANAARERGNLSAELEALVEATRLGPSQSAAAWKRLADVTLEVDPDDLLTAEDAFAHRAAPRCRGSGRGLGAVPFDRRAAPGRVRDVGPADGRQPAPPQPVRPGQRHRDPTSCSS